MVNAKMNWYTGMKKATNTTEPAKRPYNIPFDNLLIFSIPILYRNIPTTIPTGKAVSM